MLLNLLLMVNKSNFSSQGTSLINADIAGLLWTKLEPYYQDTPYSGDNETLVAQLWHDINIDDGVIALADDYVLEKGILPAQRFPWDHGKAIYIVHGYHNLHCLVRDTPLSFPQAVLKEHLRRSSTFR